MYKKLKKGDILILRKVKRDERHSGIFGAGKVIKMFTSQENYWPREFLNEKPWTLRIKMEIIALKDEVMNKLKEINPEILNIIITSFKQGLGTELFRILKFHMDKVNMLLESREDFFGDMKKVLRNSIIKYLVEDLKRDAYDLYLALENKKYI